MTGARDLFLRRIHKRNIIAVGMMICFIVSFLPVTGSWYLSLNGQTDLSGLVISAMTVKKHLDQKTSQKEIARTIDNIFKELKFATGKIRVKKDSEKSRIHLTRIVPEFPLQPEHFRLKIAQEYFYKITDKHSSYQSILILIDPPPPRNSLHILQKEITANISC